MPFFFTEIKMLSNRESFFTLHTKKSKKTKKGNFGPGYGAHPLRFWSRLTANSVSTFRVMAKSAFTIKRPRVRYPSESRGDCLFP